MVARCPSVTREGKPCSATPRPSSAYCAWHDPDLSKWRSEWSAKGGSARSNRQRAAKQLPADRTAAARVALETRLRRRFLSQPGVVEADFERNKQRLIDDHLLREGAAADDAARRASFARTKAAF